MRKSLVLQKLEFRDIRRAIENEDFSTHRARWGSPGTHGLLVLDYDRLTFDPSEREPLVAAADAVPPLPGEDLAAWRDRGFADYVRPDLTREQRLEFFRARLARVPNISYLNVKFGRWYLFFPPPAESSNPEMEQAFLEERRAAGDVAYDLGSPTRGVLVFPDVGMPDDPTFLRYRTAYRVMPSEVEDTRHKGWR